MNRINNDATLYIEAYGFTACFRVAMFLVPASEEKGEKGHF